MKKLILIAGIATLAPIAAFAQSCDWGTYWSTSQQACVSFGEITAQHVEDMGADTWAEPYTDSTAAYIRESEGSSCEGCAVSQ